MNKKIVLSVTAAAIIAGSGGYALSANAQTASVPRGVTVYLGTFIDGPTSSEFTLIDQSRPPQVKYLCAFTGPTYIGHGEYTPRVICSRQ